MINRFFQSLEEPSIVKTDFSVILWYTRIRWTFSMLVVAYAIEILFFVKFQENAAFTIIYHNLSQVYHICFPFLLVVLLLYIGIALWVIPSGKRLEQRRQAAASGDISLLAVEQPLPDVHALSLPFTIELQRSDRPLAFVIITSLLINIFGFVTSYFFLHLASSSILFIVSGILTTCILGLLIVFFHFRGRERINISEDGLAVSGIHSKNRYISWKDARLFAIDGLVGSKKYPYPYPVLFEVSSTHEVIHWTWLRPGVPPLNYLRRAAFPPEEYNQQMQALLSLIVAKTGLSLYDLR